MKVPKDKYPGKKLLKLRMSPRNLAKVLCLNKKGQKRTNSFVATLKMFLIKHDIWKWFNQV